MKYWQIAAGDNTIDMMQIFFELGIALIGPGRGGNYFDNKNKYIEGNTDHKLVKRFAEEVEIGDIFVLKKPYKNNKEYQIYAFGKVESPYRYEPIFDKVSTEKWDVQHCRRVKWYKMDEPIISSGGMTIRIQVLNEGNEMREKAEEYFKNLNEVV